MAESWTQEQKDEIGAMIAAGVKATVNGKIDKLSEKIDVHNAKHEANMIEIKPYLQFASGLGIIFKMILAIGSIATAWIAIKSVVFGGGTITLN